MRRLDRYEINEGLKRIVWWGIGLTLWGCMVFGFCLPKEALFADEEHVNGYGVLLILDCFLVAIWSFISVMIGAENGVFSGGWDKLIDWLYVHQPAHRPKAPKVKVDPNAEPPRGDWQGAK